MTQLSQEMGTRRYDPVPGFEPLGMRHQAALENFVHEAQINLGNLNNGAIRSQMNGGLFKFHVLMDGERMLGLLEDRRETITLSTLGKDQLSQQQKDDLTSALERYAGLHRPMYVQKPPFIPARLSSPVQPRVWTKPTLAEKPERDAANRWLLGLSPGNYKRPQTEGSTPGQQMLFG